MSQEIKKKSANVVSAGMGVPTMGVSAPTPNPGMAMTSPSPHIMQRIFGDPLSQSNADKWPALASSWAGRQTEMPNEAKGVGKLKPMNFIERAIYGPNSQAVTYPWGTIAVNRENVERNKIDLNSLLVHELTHIGQGQKEGIMNMFSRGGSKDMPDYEQEAYDAENNRYKKVRTTNIALPSPTTRDKILASKR